MLLVVLKSSKYMALSDLYSDKINYLEDKDVNYKDSQSVINYIITIKSSMETYDITMITFNSEIIKCLDSINLLTDYKLVYSMQDDKNDILKLEKLGKECIVLENSDDLLYILNDSFQWMNQEDLIVEQKESEKSLEEIPVNKNKITLEQLLSEDISITEADVRDLKSTQNKLKVGMILQAKSMLNRVLKLSNILDKLYDELLDRIDDNIKNTDTASLMYTTEYISKALADTNQFIMSLINNEKIQNFFIIDNSKVINISNDKESISKRENVRKAAEIVLNNLDYLVEGDYKNIINPNTIEIEEVNNVDSST